MARKSGPSRRNTSAEDSFVEIVPIRIGFFNQFQLPSALPFFDARLAINRVPDLPELLEMDQHLHVISFREAWDHSLPVLPNAARKIISYADIKSSVLGARENVDVVGFRHSLDVAWMARFCGP